jgi:hypothetical protein
MVAAVTPLVFVVAVVVPVTTVAVVVEEFVIELEFEVVATTEVVKLPDDQEQLFG